MKRIKNWLINRFLPMWAKEVVLQDNRRLLAEVERLRTALEQKEAYISGLQLGIKSQRRIIINTSEAKK